jgi:hypothetical protein
MNLARAAAFELEFVWRISSLGADQIKAALRERARF